MSLLKQKNADQIRIRFEEELKHPVRLDLFVRPTLKILIPGRPPSDFSDAAKELLEEVAALSPLLELAVHDFDSETHLAAEMGVMDVPGIVVSGRARGKVRYLGAPLGYEFSTFLQDLINVSQGSTDLSPRTRKALAELEHDVRIQVFVTPTCPYCPGPALMAHKMAIESEHVIADVVEVNEFPELGQKFAVQGVPKIVFNDDVSLVGAHPEDSFLKAVLEASSLVASR